MLVFCLVFLAGLSRAVDQDDEIVRLCRYIRDTEELAGLGSREAALDVFGSLQAYMNERIPEAGEWEGMYSHMIAYCAFRSQMLKAEEAFVEADTPLPRWVAEAEVRMERLPLERGKGVDLRVNFNSSVCLQVSSVFTEVESLGESQQGDLALSYYLKTREYLLNRMNRSGRWDPVIRFFLNYLECLSARAAVAMVESGAAPESKLISSHVPDSKIVDAAKRDAITRDQGETTGSIAAEPDRATSETVSADTKVASPRHRKRHPSVASGPGIWSEISDVLENRLAIGMRWSTYSLRSSSKETYLGTIDKLTTKQDVLPVTPFAAFRFGRYVEAELTYCAFAAKTETQYDKHTDGDIRLSGPLLNLCVRYPNSTWFEPYCGVGVALLSNKFDENPVWANGFGSYENWQDGEVAYEQWVASESPPWPNNGYRRSISLSNDVGLTALAGCSVAIGKGFFGDLCLRYMSVSVDAHYTRSTYGGVFDKEDATFPLDNICMGLGLGYAF